MAVSFCKSVDINALPTENSRAIVYPGAEVMVFVSHWIQMLGTELGSSRRDVKNSQHWATSSAHGAFSLSASALKDQCIINIS